MALVSGGSRGIGLAVARGLGAAGATVVLLGRAADVAERAADELVAEGLDAVGLSCDVADAAAVAGLPEQLGPLAAVDVLVHSAAIKGESWSKTLRTTPEQWRDVLGTNLDGAFHLTRTFAPGMVARRWGRIVHLSACLGRFTGPGTAGGLAPYRVSKAALNAFTKNLATELGDGHRGVYVDAVCPGHCRTDLGGPDAPRSALQGADTVLWLAVRDPTTGPERTGLLWEDRQVVPW